jgi:very-short-patch-repair endonuclease
MNQDKHYQVLIQRAAIMRANMTKAESKLWGVLSDPLNKLPTFEAQHVIYPYIVDFVCLENLIVIEVDGGSHDNVRDSDGVRDAELNKAGFKVIRFSNGEVLIDIETVIRSIQFECKYRETAKKSAPKAITKRSTNRMMIVPLPRLVYEEPIISSSRTKASRVRVRKIANSKNGNTKVVPCAICNQPIADNDLRVRHRIPNTDDVLWAHKSCK